MPLEPRQKAGGQALQKVGGRGHNARRGRPQGRRAKPATRIGGQAILYFSAAVGIREKPGLCEGVLKRAKRRKLRAEGSEQGMDNSVDMNLPTLTSNSTTLGWACGRVRVDEYLAIRRKPGYSCAQI